MHCCSASASCVLFIKYYHHLNCNKQWYQFQTLKLLHCRPPTYFSLSVPEKASRTLNWTSWLCQAGIQNMDLYLLGYITVHESTKIKLHWCNDRRPHCLSGLWNLDEQAQCFFSIWFKDETMFLQIIFLHERHKGFDFLHYCLAFFAICLVLFPTPKPCGIFWWLIVNFDGARGGVFFVLVQNLSTKTTAINMQPWHSSGRGFALYLDAGICLSFSRKSISQGRHGCAIRPGLQFIWKTLGRGWGQDSVQANQVLPRQTGAKTIPSQCRALCIRALPCWNRRRHNKVRNTVLSKTSGSRKNSLLWNKGVWSKPWKNSHTVQICGQIWEKLMQH